MLWHDRREVGRTIRAVKLHKEKPEIELTKPDRPWPERTLLYQLRPELFG